MGAAKLGHVRFINDHIFKRTPGQLLMESRRSEVHVARHDIARLDEDARNEMLGTTDPGAWVPDTDSRSTAERSAQD